jgi:hypothetical protein
MIPYPKRFQRINDYSHLQKTLNENLSLRTQYIIYHYFRCQLLSLIKEHKDYKFIMFPGPVFYLDAIKVYLYYLVTGASTRNLYEKFGFSDKTWSKIIKRITKYWIKEDFINACFASSLEVRQERSRKYNNEPWDVITLILDGTHTQFFGKVNNEQKKKVWLLEL